LLVGTALDDLVELAAEVPDEAQARDHDVAGTPAVAASDHQKVDGNRPQLGGDQRLHRGLVAVERVADEDDLLTVVGIELADEQTLEELTEELDELLALGGRARLPVPREAAMRELFEVEDIVDGAPDRLSPLLRAAAA